MNKNLLVNTEDSRLGACQMRWFSKLAVFNFQIHYHSEKSNRVAGALCHHPENPDTSFGSCSNSNVEEAVFYILLYSAVSNILNPYFPGTQLQIGIKLQVSQSAVH